MKAKDGMKRCSKCGETKPVGEFSTHKITKDGLRSWCKGCAKVCREEHKKENAEMDRKYNACVKKPFCPAVGGRGGQFILLTCPICGVEFRRRKATVDWFYQSRGQTIFYCSRECGYKSRRKSRTTEYAKNIKRIRQEQRL